MNMFNRRNTAVFRKVLPTGNHVVFFAHLLYDESLGSLGGKPAQHVFNPCFCCIRKVIFAQVILMFSNHLIHFVNIVGKFSRIRSKVLVLAFNAF